MPPSDPKIYAYFLQNLLLNAPFEDGFQTIAEAICAYTLKRSSDACQSLIVMARVFAILVKDAHFSDRMRAFYSCQYDGSPEIADLTRACFTDYGAAQAQEPISEAQNAQTLVSLPLGVQKAYARGPIRAHHEALLHSPWPPVIEILCQNPAIREIDILAMASRRPTQNALLEPILISHWSDRPEIRFALTANPAFAVSHALRCMLTLPNEKLTILADFHGIHEMIRQNAKRLLQLRNAP